jgi:hypothetical protein
MKAGKIIPIVLAVYGLFFWPLPAYATLITIQIEAVVDSVEDYGNYLEGQISPGAIITGYYIYESTTLDSNPLPDYAAYYQYNPLCIVSLTVGGFHFTTDTDNMDYRIAISNGYQSQDSYSVRSKNNLPLSNDVLVHDIYWLLVDDTGNALESDMLPIIPPVLNNWQTNQLHLEGDRTFLIDAHVTSAIPEPTTFLLLVLGGLLLRKRN